MKADRQGRRGFQCFSSTEYNTVLLPRTSLGPAHPAFIALFFCFCVPLIFRSCCPILLPLLKIHIIIRFISAAFKLTGAVVSRIPLPPLPIPRFPSYGGRSTTSFAVSSISASKPIIYHYHPLDIIIRNTLYKYIYHHHPLAIIV